MKKFYTLILACLLTSGAIAQSTSGTTSGIKYGIKAGVNLATISISEDDDLKSITSFQIGGTVDIPVGTSFSVQPGISLSGKGFKFKGNDSGDSYKDQTDVMYLEIPVNAIYKIGGIYLGAGPYAAFALSGKNKWEETYEGETEKGDEKIKFGSGDDEMKASDFGLNILAGYQLSSGLNFGLNYGLGLSNLMNSDDFKMKNRVFSVTVGFSF